MDFTRFVQFKFPTVPCCRIWGLRVLGLAIASIAVYSREFVVITEILKDPRGAETAIPGGQSDEFVEFCNLGNDTFYIDSLFLSDGIKVDSVMPWPNPLPGYPYYCIGQRAVAPGRCAVILDRDYAQVPASSAFRVDSTAILLTVDHVSLVDGLSANDGVFLYKGDRKNVLRVVAQAIDHTQIAALGSERLMLTSPVKIQEGFSIVPLRPLLQPTLYLPSADTCSPGRYELLRNGWVIDWQAGKIDAVSNTVACSVACLKVGPTTRQAASWSVVDEKGKAVYASTPLEPSDVPTLLLLQLPLDTFTYRFCIAEGHGETAWEINLSSVWIPANSIRITEIFPRATAEVPEWFEITNTSALPISLAGWSYGNSEEADTLASIGVVIDPGAFLVVTSNAAALLQTYRLLVGGRRLIEPLSWHTLNNYCDTLCLWDNRGNLVERVCWSSSWFREWNREALERISLARDGMERDAWALAPMPTPAQPGAAASWRNVSRATLDIGPIPFTPNGDRVDDELSIRVTLPPQASLTLLILGFDGVRLRTLSGWNQPQYLWDGRTDSGSPAPVGPFFVVAEIIQGATLYRIRNKGLLWR